MIRLILISVLFTQHSFAQPTGSITEGPRSIRSFRPLSTDQDDAIEIYFDSAGSIAIEFYEHLTLLSNPWLEGRQPGTNGSKIAGEYISWNLEKTNLIPAFNGGTSWYQPFVFDIDSSPPAVLKSFVALDDIAIIPDRDYVVLGNSGSGSITAPVTFVGYAIEDGDNQYSSFDDSTDLSGTIALILRYEPLDEHGASQWAQRRFSPHSNIKKKMQAVIDRGAIGIILVNPPNCRDGRRGLEKVRTSRFGSTDIPVVQFTQDIANLLIANGDLASLQSKADSGSTTPFEIAENVTLRIEVYTGTSYPGKLHHGADDNASGSAVIMILARMFSEYYATTEDDSLRSILFIFFDGEEAGLLGSAHFVKEPIMDLDDVNAMINLDMVGNLSNNNISISGTGTAVEFETLVPIVVEASSLTASLTPGGTGPSDHTNFYANDIPRWRSHC